MAITGIVGVIAAEIDTSGSYTSAFKVGDAINANISVSMIEGSLYANNVRKEYKQRFDSGTLELGTDDLSDTVEGKILGHATTAITVGTGTVTVVVSNVDDKAPDLGVGFYQTVTRSGQDKYRAIILKRVTFAEPQDNAQTADNSITMNGRTMTGTILADSDGEWKYDVTLDTETEAEAFIAAVLGSVS